MFSHGMKIGPRAPSFPRFLRKGWETMKPSMREIHPLRGGLSAETCRKPCPPCPILSALLRKGWETTKPSCAKFIRSEVQSSWRKHVGKKPPVPHPFRAFCGKGGRPRNPHVRNSYAPRSSLPWRTHVGKKPRDVMRARPTLAQAPSVHLHSRHRRVIHVVVAVIVVD